MPNNSDKPRLRIAPSVKDLPKDTATDHSVSIDGFEIISSASNGIGTSIVENFTLHIDGRTYLCTYTSFITRPETMQVNPEYIVAIRKTENPSFHTISIGDTGITFNIEVGIESINPRQPYNGAITHRQPYKVDEHVNLLNLTLEQLQEMAAYITAGEIIAAAAPATTPNETGQIAAAAPAIIAPEPGVEEAHAEILPVQIDQTATLGNNTAWHHCCSIQ